MPVQEAISYHDLGTALLEQGNEDEAIAAFVKALDLDPNLAITCHALARIHMQRENFDKAAALYQHLTSIAPLDAVAHFQLGNALLRLGEYEDAAAAYRSAAELDSRPASAYTGLGRAYRCLGLLDEAEAAYRSAVEADPRHYPAYNNLGDLMLQRGDLNSARHHYIMRLKLEPSSAFNALICLGIILRYQNDDDGRTYFQKALDLWETASRRRLQSPFALLLNRAVALLCLERSVEALAAARAAVQLRHPGDQLDMTQFELLQSCSRPPNGIDQIIQLLQNASPPAGRMVS